MLANVLVGFGLTMLVLGFCEASIYALLDAFDKPATYAGVFVTIQGVGAIAGGLSAGWLIRRTGEVAASALGLVILAVSMIGIAATRDLVVMLVCAGVMGLSLPLLTIGYLTLIQKRTPQAVMGRVSTAAEVVMSAPYAVSLAAGAALVSLLDYRVIFAIMGDRHDGRRRPHRLLAARPDPHGLAGRAWWFSRRGPAPRRRGPPRRRRPRPRRARPRPRRRR